VLAVGACSDGDTTQQSVCEPLGEPLVQVDYPTDPREQSLADVVGRLRSDLEGESRTAVIYLEPAASGDPDELFTIVTEVAGDEDVVLATQEDALAEYRAVFGDSSPELVDAVSAEALPAWARISSADPDVVDEVVAAVEAAGLPVYRVVTPRGPQAGSALFLRGDAALSRLAQQGDDSDVAEAAASLLAADPGDGGVLDDGFAAESDFLELAEAAEACGLLD
jgi:hypothetical protein